jgi:hypothetical protein
MQTIEMANANCEWWIVTITIEIANFKYLKTKGRFFERQGGMP